MRWGRGGSIGGKPAKPPKPAKPAKPGGNPDAETRGNPGQYPQIPMLETIPSPSLACSPLGKWKIHQTDGSGEQTKQLLRQQSATEITRRTRGDGWRRWSSRMRTQGRRSRIRTDTWKKQYLERKSVGEIEAPPPQLVLHALKQCARRALAG